MQLLPWPVEPFTARTDRDILPSEGSSELFSLLTRAYAPKSAHLNRRREPALAFAMSLLNGGFSTSFACSNA